MEAEKMLLEEEWSLIKKLPVKRISQLCRLMGIASTHMKAQRLRKIKEWCEEWLKELEETPGGVAEGEGQRGSSMLAVLVAARAGKWRRRSEEDSKEDNESKASMEDAPRVLPCLMAWQAALE